MARVKADAVESAKIQKPKAKEVVAEPFTEAPAVAPAAVVAPAPAIVPAPAQAAAAPTYQGASWKVLEAKQIGLQGQIVKLRVGDILAESSYGPRIGEHLDAAGVKTEKLT